MLAEMIVICATLSSPSLGTFFGIPPWLGDPNVPSERTYGSPAAVSATRRIDDDALKAVAAIFEGFEERAYYASEGPSNVWGVATWGPTARGANKVPFRFDYGSVAWSTFVYQPDNDRGVWTRRFAEYGNVGALAAGLCRAVNPWEGSVRLWDRVAVRRPLWRGGPSTQTDTMPGWLWSSTLFDELRPGGVVPGIPTFDWSPVSAMLGFSADEWGCALLTWDEVDRPDSDPLNWEAGCRSRGSSPVLDMISGVHYGDPPFDDGRWPERFGIYFRLTNTTCDVLEMPYLVHETWKERKTAAVVADVFSDILQDDKYSYHGYSLAHGVSSAITDRWGHPGDIEPYETFSISVRAEPDPFFPFLLDSEGTIGYFWVFTDLTVTRDSTGETAHADRADGFYVDVPAPGCRREDYAEVRCEDTGDLARSGGYFEGLAFYEGPGVSPEVRIYDLRISGESPETSYDLGTVSYAVLRSNTVCRIRDFPTNDTRRLVTDRVAGIGQALSALDRTCAPMNADPPPAELKEFVGTIELESEPVAYREFYWGDEGLVCVDSPVAFTGFAEVTNSLYVTNCRPLAAMGYVIEGCSSSSDGISPDVCTFGSNIVSRSEFADVDELFAVLGGPLPYERVYDIWTWSEPPAGGHARYHLFARSVPDGGLRSTVMTASMPIPAEGIELTAHAVYRRSYSMAQSLTGEVSFSPNRDDGILYPGSFDRVSNADLWTIESFVSKSGRRYSRGVTDPVFSGGFDGGCDAVQYRSSVWRYGSHYALRRRFADLVGEEDHRCFRYVCDDMGVGGIGDPFEVIPMEESDATGALDGHVVPEDSDRQEGSPWLIATLSASAVSMFRIAVIDRQVYLVVGDIRADYPWPMKLLELRLHPRDSSWLGGKERYPSCVRRYGAAAKSRLRGLSRVDWNWGALRRGE